jgi:hypothetical protein
LGHRANAMSYSTGYAADQGTDKSCLEGITYTASIQ